MYRKFNFAYIFGAPYFAHENMEKKPSNVGYFSKTAEIFSTDGPICTKTKRYKMNLKCSLYLGYMPLSVAQA